jgi:hypothetical protein
MSAPAATAGRELVTSNRKTPIVSTTIPEWRLKAIKTNPARKYLKLVY